MYKLNYENIYLILTLIISIVKCNNTLEIVSRDAWGATPAKGELENINLPAHKVIISHTATEVCNSRITCSERVRFIQSFHMDDRHFDDIAYNFIVGDDGAIYEGRGWGKQGAHTRGHNSKSIGIAFIGTFNKTPPAERSLKAVQELIAKGVELGKLSNDYKLYGHRQLTSTKSPGDILFDTIKTWPNFANNF